MGIESGTSQEPFETPWRVCEYDECQYSEDKGDWRPPKVYVYDLNKGILIDKTPADSLMEVTSGFRAAGCLNHVLLLGGQAIEGITLFAFNTESREFIGAVNLKEYTDIRSWLVVDNVLYTSFQHVAGGGKIMRWVGDNQDPFRFEVVGNLNSMGAFMAFHEGRIFVNAWPSLGSLTGLSINMSALYMSPVVPQGGLTAAHSDGWKTVWNPFHYDPDPINVLSYFGGAMASFDGYLWWGTYHLVTGAALLFGQVYEPQDTVAAILGTFRPIALFRGRYFDTDSSEIDLMYGLPRLPKYTPYNPLNPKEGGKWEIVPNNMGVEPLWGLAGLYNFYNAYTWTMTVHDNQLFIGTFDWSSSLIERKKFPMPMKGWPLELLEMEFPEYVEGADLFRISSAQTPAVPEDLEGIGNYFNYGIRTMLSDDALYLGMANPRNLLTDTTDQLPEGGWELIQLGSRGSGVEDRDHHIVKTFVLMQNSPNPFNLETRIRFTLNEPGEVDLSVYDIRGRLIRKIVYQKMDSGSHEVIWDGRNESGYCQSSGLYISVLRFGSSAQIRKMILLK